MKYWREEHIDPQKNLKAWKRENRDILRDGTWRSVPAYQLTKSDEGKRVKFLWQVPYEDEIYDIDGILKKVGMLESYHLPISVYLENGMAYQPGELGLGVYLEQVYVKDA